MQKKGFERVILIGHSMGGLISIYYALNLAKKDFVKAIITVASPLKGTDLAILGVGRCTRQMKRSSFFIKKLKAQMAAAKDVRFYNIALLKDKIVPWDSAVFEENVTKKTLIDGVGHNRVLFSKKVNDKLCLWIEEINNS